MALAGLLASVGFLISVVTGHAPFRFAELTAPVGIILFAKRLHRPRGNAANDLDEIQRING